MLHLPSLPGLLPSLPGFEDAAVSKGGRAQVPPRAQFPEVLTLQRLCWPIQLRFGRTNVLVLTCTLQSKEGAEEAWLEAGEGQNLQPKKSHAAPSPPLWFNADWINLDVFSNKKCRCRPNSLGPEMTANLHFLIKLAASFYERGLGYANEMVVYERLGEFGNKFHKC